MAEIHRSGRPLHQNFTTANNSLQQWAIKGTARRFILQNTHLTVSVEIFLTADMAAKGAGFGLTVEPRKHLDLEVDMFEFWTLSAAGTCTIETLAIIR